MSEKQLEIDLSGAKVGKAPDELVVRSNVEPGLPYRDYRKYLRSDFFFSCAYCTISEYEAGGLRFTIDHYEPVSDRPDLKDDYNNLLYACDQCNMRKGDLTPPVEARVEGFRFFRPDNDVRSEHLAISGQRLSHLSRIGEFSIDALDLNRLALRRTRELRRRLHDCDMHVSSGVTALRTFRIDQIPSQIRARALKAIESVSDMAAETSESVDDFLKQVARSPVLDEDLELVERRAEADDKMRATQALYPGKWRGRKVRKKQAESPDKK